MPVEMTPAQRKALARSFSDALARAAEQETEERFAANMARLDKVRADLGLAPRTAPDAR